MLKEYLSSLPHDSLTHHFKAYIPAKGLYSPGSLVRDILAKHFAPEALLENYGGLPEVQKELLFQTSLAGANGATASDLKLALPRTKAKNLGKDLLALQLDFLIYATEGTPTHYAIIPEVKQSLWDTIVNERIASWPGRRRPPQQRSSDRMAIWNDLTTFLLFCAKGALKPTQKGFIAKRSTDELLKNFQVRENFTKLHNTSYFEPPLLPDRFRFLYTYAVERDLLAMGKDSIEITPEGLAWIQLPIRDKIEDFLAHHLKKRVFPTRLLPELLHVIRQMPNWAEGQSLLQGHRETDAERNLLPATSKISRFRDFPSFFRLFCYAGLLDLAWEPTRGKTYIKASALGLSYWEETDQSPTPPPPIRITPNFEMFVPAETGSWQRFCLGFISECNSCDQVYHLHMTRESIHAALENGFTDRQITDLLKDVAKQGTVPTNVTRALQEWVQDLSRVSFAQVFALRVHDARLMAELKQVPAISGFLKQEIPGYGFEIGKSDYESVFEAMQKAGYFPKRFQAGKRPMPLQTSYSAVQLAPILKAAFRPAKGGPKRFLLPQKKLNDPNLNGQSKYGAEMKKLDLAETIQVLEYALISEREVIIDYAGDSDNPRRGRRTVVPMRLVKDWNRPELEALEIKNDERRRFLVDRIRKIAVREHD